MMINEGTELELKGYSKKGIKAKTFEEQEDDTEMRVGREWMERELGRPDWVAAMA